MSVKLQTYETVVAANHSTWNDVGWHLCGPSWVTFTLAIPQTGPALGMFDVFGRTGPPILGGRLFGR